MKKEAGDAIHPTLRDNLMRVVANVLRGERLYTPGSVGTIAKIGPRPSAGGSRSAISSDISPMGKGYCAQDTSRATA